MNPVLIDVYRSETVESFHRGAVVAVNAAAEVVFELGDINALVFPRSSLKPIQAIPLLESGAAAHFSLSQQELALCCASHGGEDIHQSVLADWMTRIGFESGQLLCGPSLPYHEASAHRMLRQGGQAEKHLHNCSGKHAGMLTLARYLEVSTENYADYNHETQQRWMRVLSELSGADVFQYPWDRDGCGLPALCLPLRGFATALAGFCNISHQTQARGQAMQKILAAMQAHPELVAGTGRCCTATMRANRNVVVKTGAEGVFAAIAPQAGIAIALKIDDGATRAADAVLGAVLRKLDIISQPEYESLSAWYQPAIVNSQSVEVGRLAPSSVWR